MGSQKLLAPTSRRAEISQCIRLLEARTSVRGDLAANQRLESLRGACNRRGTSFQRASAG